MNWIIAAAVFVFSAFHNGFSQCSADIECKGDRICVNGQCVNPTKSGQKADANARPLETVADTAAAQPPAGEAQPTSQPQPMSPDASLSAPPPSPEAQQVSQPQQTPSDSLGSQLPPAAGSPPAEPTRPAPAPDPKAAGAFDTAIDRNQGKKSSPSASGGKSVVSIDTRMGINFSWGSGDDFSKLTDLADGGLWVWGFKPGLGLGIRFAHAFSIEPQIYWEQKGAAIDVGVDSLDVVWRQSYLTVPISVFIHPFAQMPFSPYFHGGPVLSFLLTSRFDIASHSVDWSDYTSTTFFGLKFGCGAEIRTGSGNLVAEAGYTVIFNGLHNDDSENEGLRKFYVNTLCIELGYRFRL
jgi:hypothetical protein